MGVVVVQHSDSYTNIEGEVKMCNAVENRNGERVCDVKYIGYVIREGIVYYQYRCNVCGKVKEVKVSN